MSKARYPTFWVRIDTPSRSVAFEVGAEHAQAAHELALARALELWPGESFTAADISPLDFIEGRLSRRGVRSVRTL